MGFFDGTREDHDLASAAGDERKPPRGRAHVGQRSKLGSQPADFDAQPRAMRFIGVPRAERPLEERVS